MYFHRNTTEVKIYLYITQIVKIVLSSHDCCIQIFHSILSYSLRQIMVQENRKFQFGSVAQSKLYGLWESLCKLYNFIPFEANNL